MDIRLMVFLSRNGYKMRETSTLKTMKKDELVDLIRCLENNWAVELERNQNQFNLLMEKEKYRWRDLRKNPGDLPQEKKEYEIWYKAINPAYTGKKISFWNGKEFLLRRNNTGEVVAWRESEPFEEGA